MKQSGKFKDLTNQKFGRLLVISKAVVKPKAFRGSYWNVRCDCGTTKVIKGSNLRVTKSCGCAARGGYEHTLKSGYAVANVVFKNMRRNAVKRGLVFELSFKDWLGIAGKNCTYCGRGPSNKRVVNNKLGLIFQGTDRVDNSKGYVLGNCVPCCKFCNVMKNTFDVETFISSAKRIVAFCK